MAYMSQENKKSKAAAVKAICKKYGVTARLGVSNHSTLVLNISKGSLDFIENRITACAENFSYDSDEIVAKRTARLRADKHIQVNVYHTDSSYTGKCKKFFREVLDVMNTDNFDKSDVMTDYFHVGWYVNINVGKWDKGYVLVK